VGSEMCIRDSASGVYLYELRSGSFKSAKKFVMIK